MKEAASIRGIPDIIGCYNGRFFALELKKDLKEASKSVGRIVLQQQAIKKITKAGGIGAIIWPEVFGTFTKYFDYAASRWDNKLSIDSSFRFAPKE